MKRKDYIDILSKMFTTKETKLFEHYYSHRYGFYDFWDKNTMSQNDYEYLMMELKHLEYIKIDLKTQTSFDGAIIHITAKGVEYANENK